MSTFVRKYSQYLNYMCSAYKTLAMDICRIPKGYVLDTPPHLKFLSGVEMY